MKNIYRIFILLIFNSVFSIHNSFSQTAPGIEWQNTIGGDSEDDFYDIKQTIDGGFIVGGSSLSGISGDKIENCFGNWDYWIVKLDSSGNIQWQNTIGGSDGDNLHSMEQTIDGGYILGGESMSDISFDKTENSLGWGDYWVLKLDASGNILWQNTIGGSGGDYLKSVHETIDKGYILGGYSNSSISGDKTENCIGGHDYWVVKIDSVGIIQWQNTIGGTEFDYLTSILQTYDSGYIIGGYSSSPISGDKIENNWDPTLGTSDYWVVKLDSTGNILWQNTIGGIYDDELTGIDLTIDGGFILGGRSWAFPLGDQTENTNGLGDYWVVNLDSSGNIQWQNVIGGSEQDWNPSVVQTSDAGYILDGFSQSGISGDKTVNNWDSTLVTSDHWIIKLYSSGNIQWQKTIGGNASEWHTVILQTNDGAYILGGSSRSDITGDKIENCMGIYDYWIVKLFPDTITGITQLPQLPNYPITISPNPLTTQSKITFKNPNNEKFLFTLYDITGRVTESVSTSNNEIILTKGSKPAGVYLFNLVNEKTGEGWNGKIIIAN